MTIELNRGALDQACRAAAEHFNKTTSRTNYHHAVAKIIRAYLEALLTSEQAINEARNG